MRGIRHRYIGDGSPCGTTYEKSNQDLCLVLDHIHGFYRAALDRLPPSLAPRLLKAGMCVVFLDPVSNIIANTLAYTSPNDADDESIFFDTTEAQAAILSKIITDINDKSIFEMPLHPHKVDDMTLARRSLDGLLTFLTSHFRYLQFREALLYLRLARSDLVAAVRLIERDRACRPSKAKENEESSSFSITSLTTKVALKCAAVSARHPQPRLLVKASLTMASTCMPDITTFLAAAPPPLAELLRQANLSLHHRKEERKKKKKRKRKRSEHTPESSMEGEGEEHKSKRRRRRRRVTLRYTQSLVRLLLGKIHRFYLQALAKLPRDGLRKLHHCSLLKGGYCYGPMDDPVSNIVLNTIWYGSTFPTPQKFELQFKVDMILTDMLARIESCSLYGLVAFLGACFPSLTEHDAVWYLLSSDAHIHRAIHKARKHGHALALCEDDLHSAYRQAAVASWHADPYALVKFYSTSPSLNDTKLLLATMLQQGTLTNGQVESLAMALPPPPTKSVELEMTSSSSSRGVLSKNQKRFISELRKKFRQDQNFFVRMVNAALSKYSQQKGVHYKLHIICGVNPKVPDGASVALAKKNFKFEYFHVNFLATIKGPDSAVTPPQLFFAQCSNSVTRRRPSWCTPVLDSCIDNVRCYSCEYNGVRIVHPYDETYCGRYEDFNLMAHGEHNGNDLLFTAGHFEADQMATLAADWIYFDPNMDSKAAEMEPVSNVARKLRLWKGRIL